MRLLLAAALAFGPVAPAMPQIRFSATAGAVPTTPIQLDSTFDARRPALPPIDAMPLLAAPEPPKLPEAPRPVEVKVAEAERAAFRHEVKRKLFHQASLAYLAAYHLLGPDRAFHAMIAWMSAFAIVETLRLKSAKVRAAFEKVFSQILRDKERNRYTGAFYVSLGVLAILAFFRSHPVLISAAILNLALADSASALVGRRWGRHRFNVMGQSRSVEGTAAGFAVALAAGLAVGVPVLPALASAAAFAAIDAIPAPPDDNLWIPIVTAATLFALGVR